MPLKDELLAANESYASSFAYSELPPPPRRKFAVVTCMDARLDPAKALGLSEGDAHVIRNAGGLLTDDALRSLVISHWELGTQEVFVMAHTRCGMCKNAEIPDKLRAHGVDASGLDFLPFSDVEEAVRDSVRRVRESPLLPDSFTATGFVYETQTGRLREVTSS